MKKQIAEALRDFLANTYALYLKTQNYHWNVTGPEFYSLHILFEKQYENMAEGVDELAERIRSLKEPVDGTFTGFAKRSKIRETKPNLPWRKMVEELRKGHETVAELGHPLIPWAQQLHDDITSDLLIKRVAFHEKAAWMLRSQL